MPNTYNFDAVRRLIRGIFFQQENALRIFCKKEFAYDLPEGLPFLWKVELLVMRCQAVDACDQLLDRLKSKDEEQFNRYRAAIQQPANPPSKTTETGRLSCQITFKKPVDFSDWSDDVQSSAIRALAAVLECQAEALCCEDIPDDVRQSAGPVKLTVEMPENAFERLLDLGRLEDPAIAGLGIAQVKEILRNPHNIGNIRRMLERMLTPAQLREFCQRHFPAITERLSAATQKSDMLDILLNYARQNSRMPHILVFAKQQNAKVYERCEPYYYPPRIYPTPQQHAVRRRAAATPLRQPLFNLTIGEGLKALTAGTAVAAALTFLVQRVLMMPIQDQHAAEVLQLLWGTTALFGIAVAQAVLWAANRNRGPLAAGISVSAYWLGMVLGNALAYLSAAGVGFSPELILPVLLLGVQATVSPLFSFSAPLIVLILGTYWAYHYVR